MASKYLVDLKTNQIHDRHREKSECRINEIKREHRMAVYTYAEVERLCHEGFKGCTHCLPELNKD